jgi:hypothetical protein
VVIESVTGLLPFWALIPLIIIGVVFLVKKLGVIGG